MIINQEGMRYTYNGMTYTIGASVAATEMSAYRGLHGIITEIRNGADRETENDTPDIYCCFEPPVFPKEIEELEQRFSELYQMPKRLDEITLDMVIMAPEMVQVVSPLLRGVQDLRDALDEECDSVFTRHVSEINTLLCLFRERRPRSFTSLAFPDKIKNNFCIIAVITLHFAENLERGVFILGMKAG